MDLSVSFRHPNATDLPKINRLYRREYGDAYPYQLREDDLVSGIAFVAVAHGEVVGCARAIRPNPATPVFLFGGMIVDPPHRRHHIAKALTDLRFDAVTRAGARVVATEPVCCQPSRASQRNMIGNGFVPLGILPAKYPDIKPETLGDQPESLTFAIRWLAGDVSVEGRQLHLDDRLLHLLHETSASLSASADGSRRMCGLMPAPEHHEPMRGTRADGSAFVDVPANWPESSAAIAEFERNGYVACAFLPGLGLTDCGERHDFVRLVHARGRRVRFEHVHVTEHLVPFKEYLAERCGE
ncbi:hypothetical protein A2501_01975 [Candidatus Uhrbacteria bacterium RIFOXYC12_FULL_57_11]|nr:MAG: hypothetical protein A2501_01975 [Candidatus Uhrbacteria bacterium RIFOXYC12_FULL_57_11]